MYYNNNNGLGKVALEDVVKVGGQVVNWFANRDPGSDGSAPSSVGAAQVQAQVPVFVEAWKRASQTQRDALVRAAVTANPTNPVMQDPMRDAFNFVQAANGGSDYKVSSDKGRQFNALYYQFLQNARSGAPAPGGGMSTQPVTTGPVSGGGGGGPLDWLQDALTPKPPSGSPYPTDPYFYPDNRPAVVPARAGISPMLLVAAGAGALLLLARRR